MRTLLLLVCAFTLTAAEPAGQTLLMTLSGSFPLRPSSFLFDEQETSLFDATMRLKQALAEPEPRLVLDLSLGFAPGLAAAEELAAVLRSRPAGKRVACLVCNASDNAMVVAAACDEVAMVEAGILMVDGIAMSTDYYADALNRFGIKFRAVTSGPAKTAPESLTASQPSPTAIAEHQRLLNGLDKVLLDLGTRPGLDVAGLTAVRNLAPQTAAIAKATKLVDATVEPGEWLRNQSAPVRRYKIEREGPDLSSFVGLTAFWAELMAGEKPHRFPQAVAVVELEGTIIDGDISMPGYTIAGNDTARMFDDLINDGSIVAVVVRVNSPGGSADASDRIHFALRRLDAVKPVVALFDGVAASGGYYLGCAAREILVHRGTITGSIGVFAVVPDLDGMRALFGIHRHTLSTGPRADLFSTSAFTAEKEAAFRQVVSAVDVRFQSLVAGRRKIEPGKMPELAGGRVFTGEEAIALHLADRLGDLPAAVARARELAGITHVLPMERLPHRGGLAARLGLGGVHAADGLGATLPADLRLWWRLASAGQPVVMAWSAAMAP